MSGGNIIIDTGIDEHQRESMLVAEEIYARAPMREMGELLPGDIFRRDAYPLLDNAMVGREEDIVGFLQSGG